MTNNVIAPVTTTEELKEVAPQELAELALTDLDFVAGGSINGLLV